MEVFQYPRKGRNIRGYIKNPRLDLSPLKSKSNGPHTVYYRTVCLITPSRQPVGREHDPYVNMLIYFL